MKKIYPLLIWSLISAAFIGPGTVTTSLAAGVGYRFSLLWALVFSVVGCFVLQEGAARITISSGKPIGKAISQKFANKPIVPFLIALAVVTGCIAYEAGNLSGAKIGLELLQLPSYLFYLSLLFAGLLLLAGQIKFLTVLLSALVAVMGIVFMIVAFQIPWSVQEIVKGLVPVIPPEGILLVSGLIGTTIVPYNLFLGSGISNVAGQNLKLMRIGLTVAVIGGGLIAMVIMVVGTLLTGKWDFFAVQSLLKNTVGSFAANFFAIGLFAAGLTSAITAPLAAQFTLQSLFPKQKEVTRFSGIMILFIGFIFQVFSVHPISLIITAQAFNGVLLPFSAISLLLILNDGKIIPVQNLNRWHTNILGFFVTGTTVYLGLLAIIKIPSKMLNWPAQDLTHYLLMVSLLILIFLIVYIIHSRKFRS